MHNSCQFFTTKSCSASSIKIFEFSSRYADEGSRICDVRQKNCRHWATHIIRF
ncbi:DUF1540 domain-containing protein [Enterobacter sp. ENT03]|uniref:DUF1540 domain-containing protein n=1 Tax=Enterobacter sp. ENT03 TaxID=2854780 RepID=UPI003528CC78